MAQNLTFQYDREADILYINTVPPYPEQNRFLGLALRSYLETIACCDLIERRAYLPKESLHPLREKGHQLFIKLSALRKALR